MANPGIMVKPELEGRVTEIYFKPGDFVAAGDPLIQQYPDIYKAKLDIAIAQLQLSDNNYHRAEALYKKRVLSKADFEKTIATTRC